MGRDGELALFDEVLAGPVGAAVVVSGEPGIGKSVLIGEVLRRARGLGLETLGARASEFERDLPFAAFVDAFEAAVGRLGMERDGLRDGEQLAALASVFPSLRVAGVAAHDAAPVERHSVLRALYGLLELLVDRGPLVLAVDDLQWADPASVDLVCRLLHRGLRGQALLVFASRPGPSEARLSAAFDEAERHGQALRIELGPLGVSDARDLLGGDVEPALVESLHKECGGNPFYLEQLAAASGYVSVNGTASTQPWVPKQVSVAIRSEIDALPPRARALLRGAAIAGDPFEPELAAEAAGLDPEVAFAALDDLLERDLVRETSSPRRFCFRHPIVRRAVYDAAGAGWRLQAHRRAAGVLESRGASAAARAPHIERSARAGDMTAAGVLVQAGQELMLRSPASAAHWFQVALELTPEQQEHVGLRSGLMAQQAMALGFAGEIEAALEQTRRLLPHTPPELCQQATMLCVSLELLLGTHASARKRLEDRLVALEDQRGRDAGEVKRELAYTHFFDGNWDACVHWANQALECDCQGMSRVGALSLLAVAEFSLARLEHAQRAAAEAGEVYDRLGDMEIAVHLGLTIMLAEAEIHTERLTDASNHLVRAINIARTSGQHILMVALIAAQVQALAVMGRVRELVVLAEAATEEALLSTSELILSMASSTRAMAGILTGDLHGALRLAERSASLLPASSPIAGGAQLALAWVLLEIGEPERCRQYLTSPDGTPRISPSSLLQSHTYELLIAAELKLGNLARAEELAQFCTQAARRLGSNVPHAVAQRVTALVALQRGDSLAAITAASQSAEAAEQAGAHIEAARSQTLQGRALAASGQRAAAISALRQAHQKLHDCGAIHYSDQAASELRKLGRHVPRKTNPQSGKPSILGLTAREHEVMEHLTSGKTNRQIAETLYLSPRTIDRHLNRIYEKLGVHTRAAASSTYERAKNQQPEIPDNAV